MSPTIRPACLDDVPKLDAIDRRIWDARSTPAPLPLGVIPFDLHLPLQDTWVAAIESDIAGYVTIGSRSSLTSNQHVCMIRVLGVDQAFQRCGIGRRLLEEAEHQARKRGCKVMRLYVLGSNTRAIAAYERAGFSITARLEGEFIINGLVVDDLIMSKQVAP
ncbi:MAG: GNAT family N-acetyltransferase [Polyangiaceae bacterium]